MVIKDAMPLMWCHSNELWSTTTYPLVHSMYCVCRRNSPPRSSLPRCSTTNITCMYRTWETEIKCHMTSLQCILDIGYTYIFPKNSQKKSHSSSAKMGCGVSFVWWPRDMDFRADSRFVFSQWETVLLCNDVSHWLVASIESALDLHIIGH